MSKFVVVKEAPKELNEGEYLIDKPSFLEQIVQHKSKKSRNGVTGAHYLRIITDSIGQKYDPENMTAYSIKAQQYEGLPFSTDEDINNILLQALTKDYPAVFPKYLETKIKNRPTNTKLVIYVNSGIKNQYEIFYRNGLSEVEKQKPEQKKSDKVVGKPAVTNAQAEALKNQTDTE